MIESMTQAERAKAYKDFIRTYNSEKVAQDALKTGDPKLKQLCLMAYTLDALRRAGEAARKYEEPKIPLEEIRRF